MRFHEITFTSVACASTDKAAPPRLRVSQILTVRSTEHDANTSFSTGLASSPPPACPPPPRGQDAALHTSSVS